MKKWLFLLVCLLLLGLGTSCGWKNNTQDQGWSIAEESNREFSDALQLRITKIDASQNRITYEIENTTQDTYSCGTGADFSLEVLHDGTWHKMRGDPSWAITLELHLLNPGTVTEFTTGLKSELPSGTYRFIKEIRLEAGSRKQEFLACEFVIE